MSAPARDKPPVCEFCGYDMTGNVSGICPECGKPAFRFTDPIQALLLEANIHAVAMLRGKSCYQPEIPFSGRDAVVPSILPIHLLMSICTGPATLAQQAIAYWGVEPITLCRIIGRRAPMPFPEPLEPDAQLPVHDSCRSLAHAAAELAIALGHSQAGPEHLLLAMFDKCDRTIRGSLEECKLTRDNVRWYVEEYTRRAAVAAEDPFSDPQSRRGMRRPPRRD